MPQAATIKSLPRAFRMMKTMQAQGIEWGEDYRRAGALALKDVLEGRMAAGVDRHLDEMAERGAADRRNGSYRRWLDDGAGRDRAQRPAHAELERARGGARLRPARGPHRPHDPRLLRARAVHPQGRHRPTAHPRPADQRRHGEPGRQDLGCGGRRLPPPARAWSVAALLGIAVRWRWWCAPVCVRRGSDSASR